jgi:hypothetical protein
MEDETRYEWRREERRRCAPRLRGHVRGTCKASKETGRAQGSAPAGLRPAAARILRVTDDALRKRVEREERKADGTIAFTLGRNAVVACKFGSHWRYQISPR